MDVWGKKEETNASEQRKKTVALGNNNVSLTWDEYTSEQSKPKWKKKVYISHLLKRLYTFRIREWMHEKGMTETMPFFILLVFISFGVYKQTREMPKRMQKTSFRKRYMDDAFHSATDEGDSLYRHPM